MQTTSSMKKTVHKSHRLRDLILYVAIAVLIVTLGGLIGIHQAKTGQKPDASLKWVGFAILTLLVFWWAIRGYRPFWTNSRFWWFLTLFALVHLALGFTVLLRTTMTSLAPFIFVAVVESYALTAYLDRFVLRRQ
jgi:hypothetical protein